MVFSFLDNENNIFLFGFLICNVILLELEGLRNIFVICVNILG